MLFHRSVYCMFILHTRTSVPKARKYQQFEQEAWFIPPSTSALKFLIKLLTFGFVSFIPQNSYCMYIAKLVHVPVDKYCHVSLKAKRESWFRKRTCTLSESGICFCRLVCVLSHGFSLSKWKAMQLNQVAWFCDTWGQPAAHCPASLPSY